MEAKLLKTTLPDKSCFVSVILLSAESIFFGLQNLRNIIKAIKLTIDDAISTNSGPINSNKTNCVAAKEPPETRIAGNTSFIPLRPSTINTIKNVTRIVIRHSITAVF